MDALYFDCFSGAAGDMLVGALLDAGVSLADLERDLAPLPLPGYALRATRAWQGGLAGTRFQVEVAAGAAPFRTLPDIRELLAGDRLPPAVTADALKVFGRLAEAEARVHGCAVDEVHFHEVGAVDSVVDVVGFCAAWHRLGRPRILASPLAVGEGFVQTAHGRIPVPAMATLELLRGVPVEMSGLREELVTPTGAALLSTLAAEFGRRFAFTPERIGYGLGSRERSDPPNAVRVVRCRLETTRDERISVLEANLDDATGQELAWLTERCLAAGALDVVLVPAQMKKGRPGQLVQVLVAPGAEAGVVELLLAEGPTLGVRGHSAWRRVLVRSGGEVVTGLGPVRVKTSVLPDGRRRAVPEFDDLERIARATGRPLREVRREIERELSGPEDAAGAAG